MHDRHRQFLPVDPVHLLAQDLFDLPQRPPRERKIGEDARRELAHVAGPQEEAVGLDLGFPRRLAQGHAEEIRDALSCTFGSIHGLTVQGDRVVAGRRRTASSDTRR